MSERLVWDSMSIRHFKTKSSRLVESLSFITGISLARFCRRSVFLEVSRSTCWCTCCHAVGLCVEVTFDEFYQMLSHNQWGSNGRPSRPPNGGTVFSQKCAGICDLMPFSLSESCYILGRVRFVLGYIVLRGLHHVQIGPTKSYKESDYMSTCLYRWVLISCTVWKPFKAWDCTMTRMTDQRGKQLASRSAWNS